ncbi:MAG: ABC transporter ATP-binding protein [Gammaproteobacteria bacterium]|nr:MAG: ABC transporter ATP-binding protein [Gammaproteobacteria bacterium]
MIKTEHLTKHYGSLSAVEDVCFQVGPGEVLGFLGPNAAGKTTTMRMLAGFVTPTSGCASICGHDVEAEPLAAKAALGYLPEGAPTYGEMTVRHILAFVADLRALKGARREQRLAHVIERLQLGGVLDQTIETLSKGFRRRVGLAQAIVHDPPVLIPARSRYHNAVSMQLEQPGQLAGARDAVAALPAVAQVEVSERDARLTALPRSGATILPALSELAARQGLKLKELHLESGRLDEVFRSITA